MCSLERVIKDVAPTSIPVLLTGESGSGKEILAQELHRIAGGALFIKCGCGNISGEQLSSYLHADPKERNRPGPATIFLDQVDELSLQNQSRLLQMLPGGSGTLGDSGEMRLISATALDLEVEMHEGRFRRELYYRINGVCLRVPALRNRKDDIPILLAAFLKEYSSMFGFPEPALSTAAMNILIRHHWPGNVRELENFARKLVVLRDEQLALSDFSSPLMSDADGMLEPSVETKPAKILPLKEAARAASRNAERELIVQALERTRWNRKRTARELQISYKALLYKLKQLGLDGDSSVPVSQNG